MGNFTRIGAIIGIFLILGVNLSSLSGIWEINMMDSKNSVNPSNILSLTNQESSEFLPDNSTWIDYPIDDDANGYYDRLVISLGPPKSTDQGLHIYSILNDSEGNLIGIFQLYNWDIGNEILLSFPGQPINTNGANGPYHVWVGTYGIEDFQMLFSYGTAVNYNASDFESPNAKITGFSDYGNDTDDDKVFDDIIFEFTVEVKDPGYYDLEMYLEPSAPFLDSNQDLEEHWGGFLTPEDTTIVVRFPIHDHRIQYIHGPLNVSYIRFTLYGIDIQFLTDIYTTNSYFFESPSTYAKSTGNYWDWGVDTNSDGKFDQLEIKTEINVTLAGRYRIQMRLSTPDDYQGGWSEWADYSDYWNEGVHNVILYFDARLIYSLRNDTSFTLEYVRIRDENYEMMDYVSSPYTTRIYSYKEFDIPGAFVTGNFWDSGEDTNSDGKFDQLIIEVEINITLTGTYSLNMRLSTPDLDQGSWSEWADYDDYWNEGVHNITLYFDARLVYSLRNATSFTVEDVRIRDEDYQTMDYAPSPYTTRIYNYTEFDLPDARMTGKYWGRGIDTEGDSKFEVLTFNVEIKVTEASDYRIEIRIESVAGDFNFWDSRYEFRGVGLHWISFEINGPEIYRERVNSSFRLTECRIIRDTYYEWRIVDQGYPDFSTRVFNYSEFNPPNAYLTGNYWDRGVDTDLDGKFDEIIVDVEVNVTEMGSYFIELDMRAYIPVWGTGFGGSSISENYDRGIHNISVQLYVTLAYSLRLDTAYVIEDVVIVENYWEKVDRVSRPYITHKYKASEFDIPEVTLTGNHWDYGIDTDTDGKYNLLAFDIELNVTQPGIYHLEFNIHSRNWEYYEQYSYDVDYQEGIQNISLSIGTALWYPHLISTYFIIDNLRIYNSNYNLLDRLITSYITKTYSTHAFNSPPIFLTYIFYDYGENTDFDSEFEELHLYIGVNVTKTGTYTISLEVEVTKWDDYNWDYSYFDTSISQYLEEGIDIYMIVPIDAAYLYSAEIHNVRVSIQSINIYDSANYLCYSANWVYGSQEYETNDFERRSGIVSETRTLTTTTTTGGPNFNPDNSRSLNVPFGIIVLFAISVMLYLLLRSRRL